MYQIQTMNHQNELVSCLLTCACKIHLVTNFSARHSSALVLIRVILDLDWPELDMLGFWAMFMLVGYMVVVKVRPQIFFLKGA